LPSRVTAIALWVSACVIILFTGYYIATEISRIR
jgi:hypothetical protein